MKTKKAFTMIELLVVISIIGLLTTVAVVQLNNSRAKARDAKRASDIRQIVKAIELYYDAKGYYPQYISDVRCNVADANSLQALVTEGIMGSIPEDPTDDGAASPKLCYEYAGIGQAANYSWTSGWYCSGHRRTDYQYFLLFSTEVTELDYPPLTPSSAYTYCIHGDLR